MKYAVELDDAEDDAVVEETRERVGFLPIVTNWFDRVFIGIYLFAAMELLWMRFLEQSIPLMVCHVLAIALGILIVWRG